MSSLHRDKNRLFISFYVPLDGRRLRVRLYPGIRDNREGERSPILKQARQLIAERRWTELADRFPECRPLAPFRTPPARAASLDRPVDTTTFRSASERFLAYQGSVNKVATVDFYRVILKTHIWPAGAFADKLLRLIDASDIAALFGPIHQSGRQAQAANIRRVVSAVFNWARGARGADGQYLAIDNPVTRTKPVKIDRPEDEEIDPFTPDEVRAIIAAARSGWERRLVIVAIGTGLRPNENFGLKRSDVDLTHRLVRVRQTWSRYGAGSIKTKSSRRQVHLAGPVIAALREQLIESDPQFVPASSAVTTGDLQKIVDVTVTKAVAWLWRQNLRTEPHNPQNFSGHNWPAILQRAGVKHREFYQCRATFATILLLSGADWRYIADQMGHKDLTMLQQHYWKWRPGSVPRPLNDPFTMLMG